jgi:hypothetical protein
MCWMRMVWGAWLLLGVTTASAQPSDAIARAHFEAGSSDFETGDYAAAVREFERAYELSPHPPLLYNLYAAHERLGHLPEAASYLEKYLRSAEEVENRDALEARLASLERLLEPAPRSAPEAPDRAHEPPPADEPAEVSERFMQAMALFGIAGAGAITFTVAGTLALKEDKALATRCGRDAGRTCSDHDVSGLRTRSMVADIGLGVLVVGSLVGVTLLWVDRRESSRRSAALRPVASFDTHGGSLALAGRF